MAENSLPVNGGSLELAMEIHRLMEENKALRRVIEDADVKRDAWLERGMSTRGTYGSMNYLAVRIDPSDAYDSAVMVRKLSREMADKLWTWMSKNARPGLPGGSRYINEDGQLEWRIHFIEAMP